MPLVQLFDTSPEIVLQYNVKQIVSTAGDGILLDSSECSSELRQYLANIPAEKLFEHVNCCLSNSFDKSGIVLQDIINELGRRLDYSVIDGLYQGRKNSIGFDGIWKFPDGYSIVVEIKTTDAYRINLDTLADYRSKLIEKNEITDKSSMLIVVGRKDTGDLEAQIRGSRHAWDTRIISADALIKLVELKIKSDEDETGDKIRSLLVPFEYTRLDNIIDIMFTTAKDVETDNDTNEIVNISNNSKDQEKTYTQNCTPREHIDNIRKNIMASLSKQERVTLIAKKRAQFSSSDNKVRAVCAVSKCYNDNGYWYAYHPRYNNFLADAERGFFILGCVDKDYAFAIPHSIIAKLLPYLNTTPNEDKTYWHIHVDPYEDKDGYSLKIHKKKEKFDLEKYKIKLIV